MLNINTKHFVLVTIFSALVSCGAKKNNVIVTKNDTTQQKENLLPIDEYSLDFNNKEAYLGYGSILGKPIDTMMFADTVWFYCNKKEIYKETSDDSYVFYKNIKHWPKQIVSAQGETIILVERSLGEPEGSDIVAFIMQDQKFKKKVAMKKYKWWNIENDKDYTIKELQEIIKDYPFD